MSLESAPDWRKIVGKCRTPPNGKKHDTFGLSQTTEDTKHDMASSGKPSEAAYDKSDRERIRRELNDYMERHVIGVPTLFRRIAAATGRETDDAGLKALQRFLGNENRTNDATLWLYDRFLEGVDATDPVLAFGDAICKFQQFDTNSAILESVSGAYAVTTHLDKVEGFGKLSGETGRVTFDRVPERPYLRVAETMPGRSTSAARKGGGKDHEFEGIALVQAHGLGLVLRDVLTRRPKNILLVPGEGEAGTGFSGTATSPVFAGFGQAAEISRKISLTRGGEAGR